MGKSLWAVVPAEDDMQKCVWVSRTLCVPFLLTDQDVCSSVELWGVLMLGGKDMWLVSTQGTPCLGHMRLGGEGACPKCRKCKVAEHDLRTQLCLLESGLSPYLAESSVPWSQHSSSSGPPLSSQRGKLIPASGPLHGLFSPPEMFISSTFTYLAPSGVPFAAWLSSKC